MTEPLNFNPFLGWVDIADPNNIPPDAKVLSANDLLRYENFAVAARDKVNEIAKIATDAGLAGLISDPSSIVATLLGSVYATKADIKNAGVQLAYHLENPSFPRPDTTGPVMWVGWVEPLGMLDGDMYWEASPVEPAATWHTAYSAKAMTLTDAAAVSSLTDTSGNGRHALQATAAKQPKWYAGAGTPYVRFDGVDDFLQTPAFTLGQPGTLILVSKLASITTASASKEMLNGRSAAGEWSITQRGVSGNAGSEVWQAGAGIRNNGPTTDKPVAGQWFIHTFVVNGASSYLRVNGSQTVTRDFGANSLDGLTLGSLYNGLGGFANMDLAELRLAPSALTPAKVAELEAYFATQYGITL